MKNKFLPVFVLCLCFSFGACQQAQDAADDAEQLSGTDSPVTNPTKSELEAVKTPCDDAANNQEAEDCSRKEFEKAETNLNQRYEKILADLAKFEEKARAQDKILAEKYKTDAQTLQAAQRAWKTYREAQCAAEKATYGENQNAAFGFFACQQRLTEDRTEDLKMIYESK